MVPDFLKQKEAAADQFALNEHDLMANALQKQQTMNENEGLSMKELFEKKRLEAEKAVESKGGAPSKESIEDRKARL